MSVVPFKKKKDNAVMRGNLAIIAVVGLIAAFFLPKLFQPQLFSRRLPTKATVAQLKDGDDEQINAGNPGAAIDIQRYCVSGKYTIFDFGSQSCPACVSLAPHLQELTKYRQDIAVRSVDTDRPGSQGIDWSSPVCKQYKLNSIPHLKVYGPGGVLLDEGRSAKEQVIKLINDEMYR